VTARSALSLWLPVALYMAGIFLLSADSSPPAPALVSDKLLHLLAYFGLALLVGRAVHGGLPARLSGRGVLLTLVVTVGYGVTDELHQIFVPGRSPELYDVAADAAGAAVGLAACWVWGIIRAPKARFPPSNSARRIGR
jgi:VanZ family protein